jgi:hypothetical protein
MDEKLNVCARTFQQEHTEIELLLDELLSAVRSGADSVELFQAAQRAVADHYAREDEFLNALLPQFPHPAAKLLAQHAEALEIAAQAEHSLATGHRSDALSLIRRFHAIAQHNIIEEERDLFPLLPPA